MKAPHQSTAQPVGRAPVNKTPPEGNPSVGWVGQRYAVLSGSPARNPVNSRAGPALPRSLLSLLSLLSLPFLSLWPSPSLPFLSASFPSRPASHHRPNKRWGYLERQPAVLIFIPTPKGVVPPLEKVGNELRSWPGGLKLVEPLFRMNRKQI